MNRLGSGRVTKLKISETIMSLSSIELLKTSVPVFEKQIQVKTVIRLTWPRTNVNLAILLNLKS